MGDDPSGRLYKLGGEHQAVHKADDHPAFQDNNNDRHIYARSGITVFKISFDIVAGLIQSQPTLDPVFHNTL